MRVATLLLTLLMLVPLQGCFPVIAAGVGSSVMMSQDRRTTGTYVDDQSIELKAFDQIDKKWKHDVHVNVTSYNRSVLISGEVPTPEIRDAVEKLVYTLENVRNVHNELQVSATTSMKSRSNDSLITSKVKFRFVKDERFSADHVKVVTENGTVFILGLVKRAEAEAAAEVTSMTPGVQRVVKLFEYLD